MVWSANGTCAVMSPCDVSQVEMFPEPKETSPPTMVCQWVVQSCPCDVSQVEMFPEPKERTFRLDAVLTVPKWGKSCDWKPRDDAMLMLGVHWHGVAHWEHIAADDRSPFVLAGLPITLCRAQACRLDRGTRSVAKPCCAWILPSIEGEALLACQCSCQQCCTSVWVAALHTIHGWLLGSMQG